jgi:hypothetical protein
VLGAIPTEMVLFIFQIYSLLHSHPTLQLLGMVVLGPMVRQQVLLMLL